MVSPHPDRSRDAISPPVQYRPGFQAVGALRSLGRQCRGLDGNDRIPEGDGAVLDADAARGQRRQRPHQRPVEGQLDAGELQRVDLESASQQCPGIQDGPRLPDLDVDGRDARNRQLGPGQQIEPDRAVQGNLAAEHVPDTRLQMRPVQSPGTQPCGRRQACRRQHGGHRNHGMSAHCAPTVIGSASAKPGTYTKRTGRWRRSSI